MKNRTPDRQLVRLLLAHMCAAVAATTTYAQAVTPEAPPSAGAQNTAAPATTPAQPEIEEDELLVLSPFTVTTTKDQGYFAANTLAGSRMNTNIADLGAAISVVTKQQLEDTGSVDLNDVFRYEVNTEGSTSYTPNVQSLRNDGIVDVNAGVSVAGGAAQTNASANRVRGIGVPTTATNYYTSAKALPIDSYNIESLEISRGPNSMLFGMGSPAGIVNISTAKAVLNRNVSKVTFRVDDRDSFRSSFSFNRSLIADKLAIHGAFLYNDQQFERKPSYDISRRQYGAITYRPFQKTTLRANVENYDNRNRRPNTLTPRDFVSEWRAAGEPVYDSVTRTVKLLKTGETKGIYVNSADSPYANDVRNFIKSLPNYNPALWNTTGVAETSYNGVAIFGDNALTNTNSAMYVPGFNYANKGRTIMQIDNGQVASWFQPLGEQRYITAWGTATNPAANPPVNQPLTGAGGIYTDLAKSAAYNAYYAEAYGWSKDPVRSGVFGYRYPGVSDKSIYDYTRLNANQMNFGSADSNTYNIELEQEILSNLFLNAGWFKQDYNSSSNYTVAQLNAATLYVDPNVSLPDGSPNPYLGQVYLMDQDADQALSGERNEAYRAMLAYTPDFTRNDNWTKWLGRHQILGLWSKEDTISSYVRRRVTTTGVDSMAAAYRYMNNTNPNASGAATGWNTKRNLLRRYFYLSNPGDPYGAATTTSGEFDSLDYHGAVRVYNYETQQYEDLGMSTGFLDRDETTGRSQRQVEARSAAISSYLWNERLVTTFGVRRDEFRARNTAVGILRDASGTQLSPALTQPQLWVNGVFQRDLVFNRWDRWSEVTGTTSTMGGVLKPFKGWNGIDRRAGDGSLFWEIVRDFGFSYNESDNFNAPSGATTDLFGRALPKPTGEGKDYGIQFSAFKDKLFARVTWYTATNENEQIPRGAAIDRLTGHVDTTAFRNWAYTIAKINMGLDPTNPVSWDAALTPAQLEQLEVDTAAIWKQPFNYYRDTAGSVAATRNAEAEGIEMQVSFNPTPNWTMKFTGGSQETVYTKVLGEYTEWFAVRNPVWQSANALDYLAPGREVFVTYTTNNGLGRPVDLTNFWTSYGFTGDIASDNVNGWTTVQNYANSVLFPQVTLAKDLEGQKSPGQRKYRWSFLTNYNFDQGALKGWSIGGSQRWEDEAILGYYGKASGANGVNLDVSDINRPIYEKANYYTDLWIGYTRKIFNDKVRMKLQLNVNDVFEDGGLRVVGVNYDGSPYAYRIIDSRQFSLTASFDM